jgi:cell division protease FtsH
VRNRVLLDKLSKELIEYETVDAKHLARLIEEYAVDEPRFEELSRNGHQEEVTWTLRDHLADP